MNILRRAKVRVRASAKRDRIAFAIDVHRIAIDLVQKQIAHRHRAQAHRAVGTGHYQYAAAELLGQNRVAGVATAGGRYQLASTGDSSISGSIRCLEFRLAMSTVGHTAIIGPGAWWIT